MTEGDLLRRSAEGDESAFETLYQRHPDAVYRFGWVISKSPADAEDAVSGMFSRLERKAADFDPQRAQLRTWLLGIARNLCRRKRRVDSPRLSETAEVLGIEPNAVKARLHRGREMLKRSLAPLRMKEGKKPL